MATSKAQIKAVRKYENENIKRLTVYFPVKYNEQLKSKMGNQSFNGYVMSLIKKDLGIEKDTD